MALLNNLFSLVGSNENANVMSEVAGAIPSFFTLNSKFSKSIQKNYEFIVSFDFKFEKELRDQNIFIQNYHVLSINMPTSYGFKYEQIKVGPYSYSFPVMDHNGFDVAITYEEDNTSSIARLIHYLQSKIIKDTDNGANGNYLPQSKNRINTITINVFNDFGEIVRTIDFKDMFFTNATPTSLDYAGNDSLKYTITFHGDFMEQNFPKI